MFYFVINFNGMSTRLEVWEAHSLYIHIYIFVLFFKSFFLCTPSNQIPIIFKEIYLTTTTTRGHSGPGSNDIKSVFYTLKIFRTGTSPSDEIKCQTILPLSSGYSQCFLSPPCKAVFASLLSQVLLIFNYMRSIGYIVCCVHLPNSFATGRGKGIIKF